MSPAVKWLLVGASCAVALAALWQLTHSEVSLEQPAEAVIEPHVRLPLEPAAATAPPGFAEGALVVEPPAAGPVGDSASSGAVAESAANDVVVSVDLPGLTHVEGIARDDHNVVLAGHTVEVRNGGEMEGRFVTGADGHFRIGGLQPGAKVVRLLGPSGGDVLEGCIGGNPCSTALATEECSLNVTLPSEGLERMAIIVHGHGDLLFSFRIVDDLGRPLGHCLFTIEGLGADVVAMSDESGVICKHAAVTHDVELSVSFNESSDRRMAVLLQGGSDETLADPTYLPLEFGLTPTTKPDLGTLVMPRMAVLALSLTDRATGKGVYEATVHMQCTGAGLPPTAVLGEMQDDGIYLLWSGRTNGDYVLDVTAAGYRPAHQVGVLMAGDDPQPLELILERN